MEKGPNPSEIIKSIQKSGQQSCESSVQDAMDIDEESVIISSNNLNNFDQHTTKQVEKEPDNKPPDSIIKEEDIKKMIANHVQKHIGNQLKVSNNLNNFDQHTTKQVDKVPDNKPNNSIIKEDDIKELIANQVQKQFDTQLKALMQSPNISPKLFLKSRKSIGNKRTRNNTSHTTIKRRKQKQKPQKPSDYTKEPKKEQTSRFKKETIYYLDYYSDLRPLKNKKVTFHCPILKRNSQVYEQEARLIYVVDKEGQDHSEIEDLDYMFMFERYNYVRYTISSYSELQVVLQDQQSKGYCKRELPLYEIFQQQRKNNQNNEDYKKRVKNMELVEQMKELEKSVQEQKKILAQLKDSVSIIGNQNINNNNRSDR